MPSISFSGLASGIDSDSIIKTLIDSRRLANAPLEAKIESNKAENSALELLNTKLLALRDLAQGFLTTNGSGLSKSVSTGDPNVIGASVSSNAAATTTSVTVKKLAKPATLSFAERFSSLDEPIAPTLSSPGKLSLTLGTGENASVKDIEITSTTTLRDLLQKISTEVPGVYASAVNLGKEDEPSYALVLNGVESGSNKGSLSLSPSDELASLGLFLSPTLSQAEDALVSISGIGDITRPTNRISDVLPGVTLDLKQASLTPITVSVRNDDTKTAARFAELIGAFNDLVKFGKENDQIQRVEEAGKVTNKYSPLAHTRIDNQAIAALRETFSSTSSGSTTSVRVLADLGITTARDGTLTFDQKRFTEALTKDPQGTDSVLRTVADRLGATNGVIDSYTRFQGQLDLARSSNDNENSSLTQRLERVEESLRKQQESLKMIYTRLEKNSSRMTSQASALTSMIAGGGK